MAGGRQPQDSSLPQARSAPFSIVARRGEEAIYLARAAEQKAPVALADDKDLRSSDFWIWFFRMFPAHRGEAARWFQTVDVAPIEAALPAFGLAANYRNRNEWLEWAQLSEESLNLASAFDPPLAALRLWDRLPIEERRPWQTLFERRRFRRNLVKDILLDYCELDDKQRAAALQAAQREDHGFQGRDQAFPADAIRDLVRALRRPAYSALRGRIYQLKKEIGAPRGIQLEIPEDLEDTRLSLRIEFESTAELESRLKAAASERFRQGVEAIFEALRQ